MSEVDVPAPTVSTETGSGSLKDVLRYFLYLGTFGFGGPIALAGYMQCDLGVRAPARLLVFDTQSGRRVADVACVGDADDLFYDSERDRVYVIGGEGFVDIFDVSAQVGPVRRARLFDGSRSPNGPLVAGAEAVVRGRSPRRRPRGRHFRL